MRIINLGCKGSAILLTIFALLFVLALLVSYACVVNSEIMTSRNQGYDAQAYYIARTGFDHMLWRVYNSNGDIDDVASNDTQTFDAAASTFSTGTYSYSVTSSEAANGDLTLDSTGTNLDLSGTAFTREVTITLTNLARSGTATASSESAPNVASRAIDGNQVTGWQAGAAGGQWLYIDLGAACTVSRLMYRSNVSDYTVKSSLTGAGNPSLWTDVTNAYQEPAAPASPDDIYVVFDAVSAKYLCLYRNDVTVPWVYEFFIYARAESYDLAEDFSS